MPEISFDLYGNNGFLNVLKEKIKAELVPWGFRI